MERIRNIKSRWKVKGVNKNKKKKDNLGEFFYFTFYYI